MATRTATGPNGEKITFRSATNEAGEVQWIPVPEADAYQPEITKEVSVPKGQDMPYGMNPSDLNTRNNTIRAKNAYENSLVGDTQGQALKEVAEDAGVMASIGGGIVRTGDKLASGIMDLIDQGVNNFGPESLEEWSGDRIVNRASEQSKKDREYQHLAQANPIGTLTGEAVPYMLTDMLLTPASRAVTRGVSKVGGKALSPVTEAAKKLDKKYLQNAPDASTTKALSDKLEPTRTQARYNRNKIENPDRPYTKLEDLVESAKVGTAEGAAHYDQTALEGAGQSAMGRALGSISPLRGVEKARNVNDPFINETLKKFKEKGVTLSPGQLTGSTRLQRHEMGMKHSPAFADYMAGIDKANNVTLSKLAMKPAGLNPKGANVTPGELSSHMENLGKKMDYLQKNSTGEIGKEFFADAGSRAKQWSEEGLSIDVQQRGLKMQEHLRALAKGSKPVRNPDGSLSSMAFDGKNYQTTRSKLKAAADDAYVNDKELFGEITSMIKELDRAVDEGFSNTKMSAKWKDVNEKYAISQLLMESGMDATGKLDLNKLTGKLMSGGEAVRTLTSKGGVIKDLQDLVKYQEAAKREGSDMSGMQFGGQASDQAPVGGVITSRLMTMSPAKRSVADLYMSGVPLTRLGTPVGTAGKVSRAFSMPGGSMEAGDRLLGGYPSELLGMEKDGKAKELKDFQELIDSLSFGRN